MKKINDKKLRELCMAGVSNKEIAKKLGCKVEDVHARRSALGITIAKCKKVTDQGERTPEAIKAEIARVEKARKDALHKVGRCIERLGELSVELKEAESKSA